jgi:hypothetical protein
MLPDPFRCALALVPLASYALVVGLLNARKRPFVTTGGNDLAALGAAMSGLVLVGPIELFRPEAASAEFGGYVWGFLLVFYWLWLWLAVLLSRPRLVIYNITGEQLRPLVAEVARSVDDQARWAGDSLTLPSLGVELHLDTFDVMRHASLIASGSRQNLDGWRSLHRALRDRTSQMAVHSNPRALGLLLAALSLAGLSVARMVADPPRVAQAVQEMFAF